MPSTSDPSSVRAALLDTGPLVALLVRGDPDHQRVRAFLKKFKGRMLTTWPVLAEVCHFVQPRVATRFLRWIEQGGAAVVEIPPEEVGAVAALMERYADRPMDLADATLVWVGGKLGISDVLTLDRGDFQTYRAQTGAAFHDLLESARMR